MRPDPERTRSYLRKYGHALTQRRDTLRAMGRFRAAAVVPVHREEPSCLRDLIRGGRPSASHPDLLVVVVNQRENDPSATWLANRQFVEALREASRSQVPLQKWGALLEFEGAGPQVCLIDGTLPELVLNRRQGVGSARKLGMDLLCALRDTGQLASPWLGSIDADVRVPDSYFDVLAGQATGLAKPTADQSAALFPYRHIGRRDSEALAWVEASFRYYALGLASAGSPYAYHALGSAMAVHADYYAAARGFPHRQAGEDFYLLDKLARLGPIRRLKAPLICISGRTSDRVPFGTGRRLVQACSETPTTYDPRCFVALHSLLREFESELVCARPARPSESGGRWRLEPSVQRWVSRFAQERIARWRPSLVGCPTVSHRRARLHERFNALATLQFVHQLSSALLPRRAVGQVMADLVPAAFEGHEPHSELAARWLEAREADLPPLTHARPLEAPQFVPFLNF